LEIAQVILDCAAKIPQCNTAMRNFNNRLRRENFAVQGAAMTAERRVHGCTQGEQEDAATQQCGILTSKEARNEKALGNG